jgi:hypothetical protein
MDNLNTEDLILRTIQICDYLKVEVNVWDYDKDLHPAFKVLSCYPIQGCVFLDEGQEDTKHLIDIYVKGGLKGAQKIIDGDDWVYFFSVLGHELGHVFNYYKLGPEHEEIEAWNSVQRFYPEIIGSEQYQMIKGESLECYQ